MRSNSNAVLTSSINPPFNERPQKGVASFKRCRDLRYAEEARRNV